MFFIADEEFKTSLMQQSDETNVPHHYSVRVIQRYKYFHYAVIPLQWLAAGLSEVNHCIFSASVLQWNGLLTVLKGAWLKVKGHLENKSVTLWYHRKFAFTSNVFKVIKSA